MGLPLSTHSQHLTLSPLVEAGNMMRDAKFYMDYSRWLEADSANETWSQAVHRVMDMHRDKYRHCMSDQLSRYIEIAEQAYLDQSILGAQRALQFGGEQIRKHETKLYNCAASYADRPEFFQEAMYLLLSGCGVGFSVQTQHVAKLNSVQARDKSQSKVFTVPDSIQGWKDAFGVLVSSYMTGKVPFPEYQGCHVSFDLSEIRAKGSYISGGFKAPGPDGLRQSLDHCEHLMDGVVRFTDRMRPIHVYDFTMHMADAVLSGGVRRSATICLFSKDDKEMLNAKTGNWFIDNPQRGRSNNSVVIQRDKLTRAEWAQIMTSVREFGEPGFVFTDDLDFVFNPCVEIGMKAYTEDGRSGFQMCNLTEINGAYCTSAEAFYDACRAGAIMGTLQAGYTQFDHLGLATREIVEREALLGVSITGWMNSPETLFDENVMRRGAEIVKQTNKEMAQLLGINPAARTTCVKPSGNASVLLGTASGIHPEHAPRYFRNMQMNEQSDALKAIMETNPAMVNDSVWSATGSDKMVSFPLISKPGSIYKKALMGTAHLEYVKKAQQNWVEYGTNEALCTDPRLRHNVSNTIQVDDWDEVEQYLFDNRDWFAGVSLLSAGGDRAYPQAPFQEVFTMDEITQMYGDAALFASGLIVDGLHAFSDDLWRACSEALCDGENLSEHGSHDLLKRDWVRRAKQFAERYTDGELQKAMNCLKDVHNFHRWKAMERKFVTVDFRERLGKPEYTEVATMAAQACAGGACEI